jgi:hypothetical protein
MQIFNNKIFNRINKLLLSSYFFKFSNKNIFILVDYNIIIKIVRYFAV